MTDILQFFSDEKDLEKLTGLSYEDLWKAGFCLDDMDWGFVTDKEYDSETTDEDYPEFKFRQVDFERYYKGEVPQYIYMLLNWMSNYCCGYNHTEYKGKHYYTLHHA